LFLTRRQDVAPSNWGRCQRFPSLLAVEGGVVSALTQSLAYHAVAFLFQQVLERPLAEARFSQTRLPVVLTCGVVRRPCGGFHLALEYCQDPGYGGATTRLSGKPNPTFWFLGRGSAS